MNGIEAEPGLFAFDQFPCVCASKVRNKTVKTSSTFGDYVVQGKMDNAFNLKFSGHETFACRFAWLTKAASAVAEDANILTTKREDDAMASLGVGKNMVRSIRFWAEAAAIIQSVEGGHTITPFGKELLRGWEDDSGIQHHALDPYFEDIQTLWLLHWKLATNPNALIFAWDFLLNRFQEPELYSSAVVWAFERELVQKSISKGSLEQLWDVFLHSYVPTRGQKAEVREDNLDCPLVELDLLIPTGITESSMHPGRIETKYAFRREDKAEISSGLFAYCLHDFWQNRHFVERSIPLHLVANGHGSPGQVFKIPEADIRRRLLGVEESSQGIFTFEESAAIPRVIRQSKMQAPTLQSVYREETTYA